MAAPVRIAEAARREARTVADEAAELVRVVAVAEKQTVPLVGAARWAHLPGGGRGPSQPSPVGRIRVVIVGLIKPVVMIGFLVGVLWFATQSLPGVFKFGGIVPSQVGPSAPAVPGAPVAPAAPPVPPAPAPAPPP